jgi:putative membrane protein
VKGFRLQLDGSLERQRPLAVRATPATGEFAPILPATPLRAVRASLTAERPTALSVLGTELRLSGELRATRISTDDASFQVPTTTVGRAFASVSIERPFESGRLVLLTAGGAVGANGPIPPQEWIYFGGPVSAPGYQLHELATVVGVTQRVEWRTPIPAPSFSLGRFGRAPGRATLAPFAQATYARRAADDRLPAPDRRLPERRRRAAALLRPGAARGRARAAPRRLDVQRRRVARLLGHSVAVRRRRRDVRAAAPVPPDMTRREPAILLVAALVRLALSRVGALEPGTWILEVCADLIVAPILVSRPALPAHAARLPLLFVHALILMLGGHYTYAKVPLGFWAQDAFGLAREPLRPLGHLAQGFVPAMLAREVLLRRSPLERGKWLGFLVVCVCLALSATYELIEWLAACSAARRPTPSSAPRATSGTRSGTCSWH